MKTAKYIWMNGKFVKWKDANIHVASHTLHYGNGVFEGIRAYKSDKGLAIYIKVMNPTQLAGEIIKTILSISWTTITTAPHITGAAIVFTATIQHIILIIKM